MCDEIWVVGDRKVLRYDGSFDDYKKSALKRLVPSGTAGSTVAKR